jgi:hypothetical protein
MEIERWIENFGTRNARLIHSLQPFQAEPWRIRINESLYSIVHLGMIEMA